MSTFKKPKLFIGIAIENQEVPFERLAYATTDVFLGPKSVVLYGFIEFIPEIASKMDKNREFNSSDIFPGSRREVVDNVLEAFCENSGIIKDLGNGRYCAKETVYVERGKFVKPPKASEKSCDRKSVVCV